MGVYTLKCDAVIKDVTVGISGRSLPDVISNMVMEGMNEARVELDADIIKEFVAGNCLITFELANIPFRIKLV